MKIEVRQPDGYLNATLMCKGAGREWSKYAKTNNSKAFMNELQATLPFGRVDLVSQQNGANGERHTWVHQQIAIDLARWISPKFGVWMTGLVLRFARGEVTTEQSRAAAQEISEAVEPARDPPQVPAQLIQWNRQRDDSRELTKTKSDTLKEVTGGKAYSAYWRNNDAINKAATGKTTKELRVQLGIKKGTPRDRMGAPMLGMIAYQEGMVDKVLREAKEDKGDFLKDWEAIGVAETVTDEAEAFCKKTKGFELPMLQYKPPQVKQVQKALQAKKPTMRQQRLITAAMMPVLKALPAPPVSASIDLGDLYD